MFVKTRDAFVVFRRSFFKSFPLRMYCSWIVLLKASCIDLWSLGLRMEGRWQFNWFSILFLCFEHTVETFKFSLYEKAVFWLYPFVFSNSKVLKSKRNYSFKIQINGLSYLVFFKSSVPLWLLAKFFSFFIRNSYTLRTVFFSVFLVQFLVEC